MLAYAAHRRRIAQRASAPHAMLVIVAVHVALIAAVMSAKMDLPERIFRPPTEVELIELPKPPPPQPQPRAEPRPSPRTIDRVPVIVALPQPDREPIDARPVPFPGTDTPGPTITPVPRADPLPAPDPVRVGPRFATPPSAVRPPYPPSKLNSEEEAVFKLKLSIDERGRVVAVAPVGRADPAFLAAARRHLLARWRYRPATVDGRAIASSTVITLRFQLED